MFVEIKPFRIVDFVEMLLFLVFLALLYLILLFKLYFKSCGVLVHL